MADVKISGLPSDSALDANHYVPINDPSGPTTKRTLLSVLAAFLFSQTNIPDGSGSPRTRMSETMFDHAVANTGVWSGDAYASTRNASMTALTAYINGRRLTVTAVVARSFTASRDTYVDVLDNADGTATLVYTEVTNNNASPALAANSLRLAVIVTGASNIANVGSVNQGQEEKVLPIASSTPYAVTDSLGNLICPRDPSRKVLGYRQIVTGFTTAANNVDTLITGLSVPVKVPLGRKIKVLMYNRGIQMNAGAPNAGAIRIWEGTVGSGTQRTDCAFYLPGNALDIQGVCPSVNYTPTTSAITLNASIIQASANTKQVTAGTTDPAYLRVELE